jgi:hypothetical protein
MITLDPAQFFALRKSASGPVQVGGHSGSGKSTLANAIALQSARDGRSCLLIGNDASLDRPIAFQTLAHVHRVLAERAQLNDQIDVPDTNVPAKAVIPLDLIEARAKTDPIAAKAAVSLLQRTRELSQKYKLNADEIEESISNNQSISPDAFDLAALAVQDGSRLADQLWSGNGRAGRSFHDLKQLLAGTATEVPANDQVLKLILADDATFEADLVNILSSRNEHKDEQAVAAIVGGLRRLGATEKTLRECQQHAIGMSRIMNDAIALVRKHGSLKAAFSADADSDGAKAIGFFMRMRPQEGSAAAVRAFDSALRDYQIDSAALEPHLNQYGNRSLASFVSVSDASGYKTEANPGSFVQRIREARYAARQLPGLLNKIRTSLPQELGQRFESAPVEDAAAILEKGSEYGPREKAAGELRQLRSLFAQTGFGDPLNAPADFESRIDKARAPALKPSNHVAASAYSPEVLDLLLGLTTYNEYPNVTAWPTGIARARNKDEIALIAQGGRRFDVVVVDDAADIAPALIAALAQAGATVHRIGIVDHDDAILLDIPHRQQDTALAGAVSGQHHRWLGAPDGSGLVVRPAPELTLEQLHSAAGRLVGLLQAAGCSAELSTSHSDADFVVASLDQLTDSVARTIASRARKGAAILCRSDLRSPEAMPEPSSAPDVLLAQSLGWKLVETTADGALLEKDGRSVVLVDETVTISGRDETVADVACRLGLMGWHPVVSWRFSSRTPDDFGKLLNDSSVPTSRRYRTIAETFDLKQPLPPGGDYGTKPVHGSDVARTTSAITTPPATAVQARAVEPEIRHIEGPAGENEAPVSGPALSIVRSTDENQRSGPTADVVSLKPRHVQDGNANRLPEAQTTDGQPNPLRTENDSEKAEQPASPFSPPVEASTHTKLQINPTLLDRIVISIAGHRVPLPHVARMVVSTALQTQVPSPICIVLPSTEHVAQFAAILSALQCLASDFPNNRKHFLERYFKPGASVRILPDKNVFVVGTKSTGLGKDGVFLGYTEKETLIGDGRRLFSNEELFRFEPTTRQLPKSRSSIRFNTAERTKVDELAEVETFGNSGLYNNRVVLIGSQKEFGRVLDGLTLVCGQEGSDQVHAPLVENFAWGNFDENGQPFVLSPEGSGGAPLVAIARDLAELERASLHPDIQAGSQIVLTDRLEHVLKNVDLANRVGERQRLIVFADGRQRADALTLRKNGWIVWEPQPWELVSQDTATAQEPAKTGVLGLDRTQHSALVERRPGLGYLPRSAPALSSAYGLLQRIGDFLTAESAVDDSRMQAIMDTIRDLFFGASNWLTLPNSSQMADCLASLQHLRGEQVYVTRYLGPDAGTAVGAFATAIESFVTAPRKGGMTPKGEALLELARNAALHPTLKQVLVTGSRQSREEADAFLAANDINLQCKLATELADGDEFPGAISFSILRRDMFEKFFDPWPSKAIVLTGYDFELNIYKQRLRWRDSQKRRLGLDPDVRTRLTALSTSSFGTATQGADSDNVMPDVTLDPQLDPFEQISRIGKSETKRSIRIDLSPHEQSEDAHIVRFVGQSWMPMATDYRPVCLIQAGADGQKSGVEHIEISDLRPGMRIIARESGEKDVIKAVAQDACGDEKYDRLWKQASLWREALNSGGSDPGRIARRLQDSGIRRHIVTLRSWLTNPSLIGPRSEDDVLAIAKTFPLAGKSPGDWKGCCDAISELRGHHLSAGMKLADHLANRCGRMLLEPTETETAVEFQLGTVWILEVAEIEPSVRSVPTTMLNRLQWLNSAWQARRYGERLRVMAA